MIRTLLFAVIAGIPGAAIGAVALSILTEGLSEGAVVGAILGLCIGAFFGARISAHRAAIAAAELNPEEAARSSRNRDVRLDASTEFARHNQRTSDSIGGVIDSR